MQGKKTKCSNEGRKKNYLARRRLCVTGGAAAEAGGGVVAHGWRLQAALRLFRTSGGVTAFFSSFLPVSSFSLSLPMFRSSFFLPFPLFSQSVFFFRLLFFYVFLSSRFLSSFGSSSLSFFFLLSSVFFGLFIEPRGGAFYGCTWGARAAAVGRPFGCSCRGSAPCFSGRRAAGGRPVSSVGGPTAWGFGLVASRRGRLV